MVVIAFDDVEVRYKCSRKRISKSGGKVKYLSCHGVIRKYCK